MSAVEGISVWLDQSKKIDYFLARVEARPKSNELHRRLGKYIKFISRVYLL